MAHMSNASMRSQRYFAGMDSRTECSRPRPDQLEAKAKPSRGQVEA